MGGGLMQLVAYGAQDIYLTGNPQITFFKVVYRRHTNFSMESIKQTLNGSSTNSGTATCTVSRNGDLVYKTYVTFTSKAANTNGSALITDVELEIGGQRIDRHYQEWNEIWNELSTPESKAIGLKAMQLEVGTGAAAGTGVKEVHVPLNFWFCRNPGLALPLIALQYHEVKLKFTWGAVGSGTADVSPQVWCDYIYLDTDERRRFAQVSHEYLIEQVQRQALDSTASIKLNFNHPVKELIWTSGTADYGTARLTLNGHDRFADQKQEYFQLRQSYDYHTAVPAQNLPSACTKWTTFEMISGSTGNAALTAAIAGGVNAATACAATAFNVVKNTTGNGLIGDRTTPVGALGVAGAVLTGLLSINGTTTGSFANNSIKVGDVHLLTLEDPTTTAASKTTFATVFGLFKLAADATVPNDGTGPVAEGQTITSLSGTAAPGSNALIVQYSSAINTISTITDSDALLTVEKVADSGARTSKMSRKINVYSFALKPEEHQPSGTCNFSRIDNAKLELGDNQLTSSNYMYAVNYNVLRIMSGMGGLAYSN